MRLVVLKNLAKLTFGIAAITAATSFGSSPSQAFGDAPWCAVKSLGKGDVYWDCQYRTFAACYPNALADRGFLQREPMAGTITGSPLQTLETPRAILIDVRIAANIAKLPGLLTHR